MTTRFARLALAPAVAGAVLLLAGAADDSETIKAGEISFKVPAAWKREQPKNNMRKAQLKVGPSAGDPEPAEMILFVFPNGAGTVEANVKRWESGFKGADGTSPKAKVEEKKGSNVEVTRVEIDGRYTAAMMPGAAEKNDKPDYRLLGAIVQTAEAGYFFRLVGPDKTIKAATPAFDAMIASLTKAD